MENAHLPEQTTHNQEITQALNELNTHADLVIALISRNQLAQSTVDRLLNRVAIDAARCAELTLAQFADCNGGESGVA